MCQKRLLNFLEKFKILFDNQFGFRSKYSTDFALLKIVDKIQRAIDEHDYSCGIFLDFSKAFDTVNHEIKKIWGNTYSTTIQPLFVLQKRAIRIISFAKFDEHSAPLFLKLYIIKMFDLVNFQISIFMFKLHNNLLPKIFQDFFIPVNQVHSYQGRTQDFLPGGAHRQWGTNNYI